MIWALLVVGLIRALLWLLPFVYVQRVARWLGRRSPRAREPLPASLVDHRALLIRAVSRLVPGAACLTQALALQVLLARSGNPSLVRIGIKRGEEKSLEAHAWLEWEGRVVIGDSELGRYVRLPEIGRFTA